MDDTQEDSQPPSGQEDAPLAEARRLLAEHEQARMQACLTELTAVLDKYGMDLTVTPARATLVPR
jgi:hypothetical protein